MAAMMLAASGGVVLAQTAPAGTVISFLDGEPGSITVAGITVSGTVDVGFGYQSHGAPMNAHYTAAQAYIVQKASNREHTGFSPSALQQSSMAISGKQTLTNLTGIDGLSGWSLLFRGETGFNPLSGQLADSPKSLAQQNGVPITQQTSSGDSSRAGQIFNGDAYVGLANTKLGELRFGRNSNLMQEGLAAFDPQLSSVAFSPFGYSGNSGGLGVTEDGRHDNSFKYKNTVGPAHVAVDLAYLNPNGEGGNGYEVSGGFDFGGLTIDGVYGKKKDAIAAAPLNSTTGVKGDCALAGLGAACSSTDIVNATISDNRAMAIMAKYKLGAATLFAGYENIHFANPADLLTSGGVAGGHNVFKYTNNAFMTEKILETSWMGVRYAFTPKLTGAAAWYHTEQNAYLGKPATGKTVGSPCANAAKGNLGGDATNGISSNCGGRSDILSATLDYQMTKRLDVYAGFGWSKVEGGLSSGYVKTETIDPMVGARLKF